MHVPSPQYTFTVQERAVIYDALNVIEARARTAAIPLESPSAVTDYLRLRTAGLEHEVFGCLWTDAQNRLILAEEIFRGTLTQTSVFPREIVKRALAVNAGGVILYHNHPSGIAEASAADTRLTECLKAALALVDVRVLDHFIIGESGVLSFAERGLI